jgi:hypothetical protein
MPGGKMIDEDFIQWLHCKFRYNIYTRRWTDYKITFTATTTELYNFYTMDKERFQIGGCYTCENGSFKVTFICRAKDGEYLFPTENINGVGYSILLCRPATEEEMKPLKDNKYI